MKVYTISQVAEVLQVCNETVKNEIKRNKLKALKVGTEWRIPGQNLDDYLQVIANNYKTNRELELEKELGKVKKENELLKSIVANNLAECSKVISLI